MEIDAKKRDSNLIKKYGYIIMSQASLKPGLLEARRATPGPPCSQDQGWVPSF